MRRDRRGAAGGGLLALMPLALMLLALPGHGPGARAEVATLYESGPWRLLGGTSEAGSGMCALTTSGGEGRAVYLKYFSERPVLQVQLFRDDWRLPPDARLRVELTIDALPSWSAVADRTERGENGIVFGIGLDLLGEFEAAFRAGRELTVAFHDPTPDGREAPWRLALSGADEGMTRLAGCIAGLRAARAERPPAARRPAAAPAPRRLEL